MPEIEGEGERFSMWCKDYENRHESEILYAKLDTEK